MKSTFMNGYNLNFAIKISSNDLDHIPKIDRHVA